MIDDLKRTYRPVIFPHGKIVAKLRRNVLDSRLAGRFHGSVDVLCAGCHHHSPVGARPPACRACHGVEADATTDEPGLSAAYHRQCIGCHHEMGIDVTSCVDCHELDPRKAGP